MQDSSEIAAPRAPGRLGQYGINYQTSQIVILVLRTPNRMRRAGQLGRDWRNLGSYLRMILVLILQRKKARRAKRNDDEMEDPDCSPSKRTPLSHRLLWGSAIFSHMESSILSMQHTAARNCQVVGRDWGDTNLCSVCGNGVCEPLAASMGGLSMVIDRSREEAPFSMVAFRLTILFGGFFVFGPGRSWIIFLIELIRIYPSLSTEYFLRSPNNFVGSSWAVCRILLISRMKMFDLAFWYWLSFQRIFYSLNLI